jgi:hypothetical protein
MPMKVIEIDFDIHRLIELERCGFDEPENSALRRLLKLPETEAVKGADTHSSAGKPTNGAWSWKGVSLPAGTELRMDYGGQEVRGVIENGKWMLNGTAYNSPSDAASSSVKTKDRTRPNLNGWLYWQVRRPGDTGWRMLQSLKPR